MENRVDFATTKVAKDTARQKPQPKIRNISRKDAKAKENFYPNLALFAPWPGGISESEMFRVVIRFAHGAQILKHNNTAFQTSLGKEIRLVGEQLQPKAELSPQRRQGAKLMNPCPSSRANARDLKDFSLRSK